VKLLITMNNRAILIVEDNVDDQFLILNALEAARVQNPTVVLETGEEALSYLNDNASSPRSLPCMVMLDLTLPPQNGLDVLKAIRSHPGTRRIPVIVLTGSSREQDREASYANGANSYVTKEGNLDAFFEKIQCLCNYWLDICQLPAF
jgi:two-component system response regulator